MSKPWLRLYRAAILKPKVGKLTMDQLGFWAACLMLSDDDGKLPPLEDICWSLRLTQTVASDLMYGLQHNGLVTRYVTEGVTIWSLHDWDEHQRKSDHDDGNANRQKAWRERQKAQKSAIPVTDDDRNALRNGSVTLPDTDTDTDTDKTLTSFVATQSPGRALEVAMNIEAQLLPSKASSKRGTSLPPDFVMPDAWVDDARIARGRQGKGDINYRAEVERFVNHFVANGKTMKDWRRAWLNWATSPFVDKLKGRQDGTRFSDTMRDIAREIDAVERGGGIPDAGAVRGGMGGGAHRGSGKAEDVDG